MRWSLAVNCMFRAAERNLQTGGRLAALYQPGTEQRFNVMVSWVARPSSQGELRYGLIA